MDYSASRVLLGGEKKTLIVVDLLVCNNFQRGDIKKQLIHSSAIGGGRWGAWSPGGPAGSAGVTWKKKKKKRKNTEKMAFSVTSAAG